VCIGVRNSFSLERRKRNEESANHRDITDCMFISRASLSVYRQQYRFYRSLSRNNISVVPPKMEVNLTETENSICELLDGCTKFLESEKGTRTSCRIAGGWVRDKVNSFTTVVLLSNPKQLNQSSQLLGLQSNDMDIALGDIMGLAFAEHLAQYAQSRGIETGRIAKIQQNPDQSKHLETATLKVFGRDIDLVNLRSEEYAEGSRIPTGVVSRFYFPPQCPSSFVGFWNTTGRCLET